MLDIAVSLVLGWRS